MRSATATEPRHAQRLPSVREAAPAQAEKVEAKRSVDAMERPSSAVPSAARAAAASYAAAFGRMDVAAMEKAMAPSFRFFDPTLPAEGLTRAQTSGYWTAASGPDNQLKLVTSPVTTRRGADGNVEASFTWKADYRLAGRPIHNEVATTLTLSPDGKLLRRTDDFDTGRWLAQAAPLGIGRLIEGTDDLLGTHLATAVSKLAVRLVLRDVLAG